MTTLFNLNKVIINLIKKITLIFFHKIVLFVRRIHAGKTKAKWDGIFKTKQKLIFFQKWSDIDRRKI